MFRDMSLALFICVICDFDPEYYNYFHYYRFIHQVLVSDFPRFFLEQNNHIFQTLMDVSESQDKALTTDHMKAMGLDPIGDRQFIMDLVELYGIDVILMVDNPCCPV